MIARILAEIPATKELKKYINIAKNNFKIDFDYNIKQWIIELFNSNRKSPSSTHEDKVSSLYTTTLSLQDRLNDGLDFTKEKEAHL